MADAYKDAGFPEKIAELPSKPDENFSPDMAQQQQNEFTRT